MSDLISREFLQTAIHNFFYGLNHTPTEEDIQRYIEVAPSVEIKGEWIPVSERLPEIHQDVLLSLRSLDVEVGFRGETEPYYYCHGDYIEPQNVLAWQPLPEPYNADMRGDT